MISSLIGGAGVAIGCLIIAWLRVGASRVPQPFWARGEASESTLAVGIVCMLASGLAMIVSAVGSGLVAVLVGLAVAVGGSVLAIVIGARRNTAAPAGTPATKGA
ncbi:MAG TPA: hypothetical protein VIF14_01745 [Alphaproteobacteria bacterium]|jgi:hypothetical protein